MTGALVAPLVREHERKARRLLPAQAHVREALRTEAALARKLDGGLFGPDASGRPWPEHDASLCRQTADDAARAWLLATVFALELLLGGDR